MNDVLFFVNVTKQIEALQLCRLVYKSASSHSCTQRDGNIIYREEIPNLGPTKTRAHILHCRLWGSSENKGTDSGTKLHPLAVHDYMTKYHRTPRPTDYRYKYVSKYVRIHAGQYFILIEGFNTKV
jgi:hypothetical protein